jgi:N-acetylglucosaminyl-diphospho-decaprenol L-rhamnosyltransferase
VTSPQSADGLAVAVIIVCHQSAGDLPRTLAALSPQLRDDDRLIVVDNASQDDTAGVATRLAPEATVLRLPRNAGFAGGANAGAAAADTPLLFLLNPDARPASDCIEELRACAATHPAWGAWQALVDLPDGRVNTAGNVVHFLGIGWAGGLGRSADEVLREPAEVGFASGAALMVRRGAWDAVRGFDDRYFMYGEDLDLSLRLRLAGWGVGVSPSARVTHDYEFAKGDYKWFYLERNRWWTLLGVYPAPLLAAVAPALAVFELLLLPVAWRGGWLGAKLRAQVAVVRLLPEMLGRRRAVQGTARITPSAFAKHLVASLDSPQLSSAHRIPVVERLLGLYWRLARWTLGRVVAAQGDRLPCRAMATAVTSTPAGYVPFDPRPAGAHAKLLELVPRGARVLDAGCSTGYLAEQLVGRGSSVVGLELDPVAGQAAERWCEQVLVGDFETMELPFAEQTFDVVLCGDIVEHLRDPGAALARVRPLLKPGGRLVLSTPNVANWSVRASLLAGRFEYTERGLLDRTHAHLFTRRSLRSCLRDAGYEVIAEDFTVPLPYALRRDGLERGAHRIGALKPTLLAYQWVMAARPAGP